MIRITDQFIENCFKYPNNNALFINEKYFTYSELLNLTFSILLEQTWNSGYSNMFMPMSKPKHKRNKESRHRRTIVLDPFKRKHAQTVPEMHKPDMSVIQQVERLKNNPSVNVPVNIVQLRAICKKYNIL